MINFKNLTMGLAFCALSQAGMAQDIKVGALFPFSGALAQLGEESYRGVEIAIEQRNALGGVNGRKLKIIKGDAVDASQAVGEARRLTSVEKVDVVTGTYSSGLSFAATQVTELAGVPYFELGAISDAITGRKFKYLFRTNPTASSYADVAMNTLISALAPLHGIDPKAARIAIIHEDTLFGTTLAGLQKSKAAERGLNVVEVLPYSAKAVDLSSLVLRLKSAKADFVLQTSYQNDTVLFFRQMKEAAYKPKAIIGAGGGYALTDTAKALGADFDGALSIDFTQFETNEKAAPGLKAFVAAYKAKYGSAPKSGHSLANYVGAKAMLEILAQSKTMDKDAIRSAAMGYVMPTGATANGWGVKFTEDGQNALSKPYLMQWQAGKLVTVFPKDAAVAQILPTLGR